MAREDDVSVPIFSSQQWRDIFNKYDRNNDDRISYVELKCIIESQECPLDVAENVVKTIMRLADKDNSGYLEFNEFMAMMNDTELKAENTLNKFVYYIIPKSKEQRMEYTCWPPPVCMLLISVVEIVLFCYNVSLMNVHGQGPIANLLAFNPTERKEAWRYLTYMFVHSDVVHLLLNLVVQLFLGVLLEMVHRSWRVGLVYLAGVVAASLAFSLTNPRYCLAGSSGGVSALSTAHIAAVIMNWSEMKSAIIQLLVYLVLASLNIGWSVYGLYYHKDHNISYVSHLAGALAGLLVGVVVLRNVKKEKWEKRLRRGAVVLYLALIIGGILANIFWSERFSGPKYPCIFKNILYVSKNVTSFQSEDRPP